LRNAKLTLKLTLINAPSAPEFRMPTQPLRAFEFELPLGHDVQNSADGTPLPRPQHRC
jgi:hypothetical protein